MRLTVLDTGHSLKMRVLFAIIRMVSHPTPEAIKTSRRIATVPISTACRWGGHPRGNARTFHMVCR
jgi:hypothetical protein